MSQFFSSGDQSIGASALASSPSNEYSGLISFRIDWFDLAVQGTLKSHLQHHSSKASILWCSAFFMVQLSHPHMATGKTIALTIQTFVGKVMSLLFVIPHMVAKLLGALESERPAPICQFYPLGCMTLDKSLSLLELQPPPLYNGRLEQTQLLYGTVM